MPIKIVNGSAPEINSFRSACSNVVQSPIIGVGTEDDFGQALRMIHAGVILTSKAANTHVETKEGTVNSIE